MAQIDKPNTHFNPVLYTGNGTAIGSGGKAVTGVGYQPDFIWIKDRTNAENHFLVDSIRGAQRLLYSNLTLADDQAYPETINSIDSDGFTLGNSSGCNANNDLYASWNWKAGGTASSNTDGSITSSVSANTTSGFSIVKYTNQNVNTIGHGLGVVPKVLIGKCLSGASGWVFASADLLGSWDKYLLLNSTNATGTDSRFFYPSSAAPTSTVFSSDQSAWSAGGSATEDMIAYCFAEKKGFSKFGSYTGNGNADGTFVYTGFKPAFVMFKNTSAVENWRIVDNKRDIDNPVVQHLYPNLSNAEGSGTAYSDFVDFLSNGFKIRSGSGEINGSGGTYIYMAFAENPLVGTNGVPATAR